MGCSSELSPCHLLDANPRESLRGKNSSVFLLDCIPPSKLVIYVPFKSMPSSGLEGCRLVAWLDYRRDGLTWGTRGPEEITQSDLAQSLSAGTRAYAVNWKSLSSTRIASKMGVNHSADRNQYTFHSRGPKTTKEAFQGEIHVATLNQKASGFNFALTHFSPT